MGQPELKAGSANIMADDTNKKNIELSLRMQTVADMVQPGGRVCDIGCDHAFVSIYLVANGIADHVIASDVRTGPCAIARENIARWGMDDRIDLRLGDGLDTVKPGETDSIIIAGMGGILITDILSAGKTVVDTAKQLVLQPQSELEHVRRYIHEQGWFITDEKMLVDAGKYYVVMSVDVGESSRNAEKTNDMVRTRNDRNGNDRNGNDRNGNDRNGNDRNGMDATGNDIAGIARSENYRFAHNSDLQEIYFKYGRRLLESHSAVLKDYLEDRRRSLVDIISGLEHAKTDNARKRCLELRHEQECIERALELI